jgi:hypothetical protein
MTEDSVRGVSNNALVRDAAGQGWGSPRTKRTICDGNAAADGADAAAEFLANHAPVDLTK